LLPQALQEAPPKVASHWQVPSVFAVPWALQVMALLYWQTLPA
jgi:hypothetical protein